MPTKDLLLDDLNLAQKEAVTHGEGPLLIVAGAGTGKTTVITRRIAWLIREGKAKGDEILGLTFTDKAAGEMEERVDRLLPMGYTDLWLSTFHAFGERLLRAHAIDIGLPNEFKLLDTTAQWMLIRRHFDDFDLDYYRPRGNPTRFIHALLKHFSRAKDEGVSANEYLDYIEKLKLDSGAGESAGGEVIKKKDKSQKSKVKSEESLRDDFPEGEVGRLEEIAKAYKVYEQLVLNEGALDFGDLIMNVLLLLKSRPKILEQYRRQFKYILVDEFQDTNWAQYELVKLLASTLGEERFFSASQANDLDAFPPAKNRPPLTPERVESNLTVVADDDQSIYRFRGAAMSNILQFEKDFPAAQFVVLTENYRSQQEVLDLSYAFIQKNNPNRLEARSLKASNATPPPLMIRGGAGGVMKKLKAANKGNATIEYVALKSVEDETRFVVEKILELVKGNPSRKEGTTRERLGWNDFAILVRANSQADAFVQALTAAGIPTQYVASKGLYAKPIVLDVVSWLKLLDNYHESTALWRILNAPPFNIPWHDTMELTAYANRKSISLYEALRHARSLEKVSKDTHAILDRVTALIERHTQATRTKSVGKVILQFLEESGYLKTIAALPEGEAKERFSFLNQFFKDVSQFEQATPDPSSHNFLEMHLLALESGEAGALDVNSEEGPETVKVMTIHAAKGLEFNTVFVVQMVDKRFPSIDRQDPIELPQALVKEIIPEGDIHLEEERRLLYVAMTRAKKRLYFTGAEDYGGQRKKKPSQFLHELGFVESGKEGGKKEKKVANNSTQPLLKIRGEAGEGMTPENIRYKLPERFSFTQLKAFESCPYQYRFAHILKVPVKGRFTFSFGKTMHATLQQFFELIKIKDHRGQQGLFGSGSEDTTEAQEKTPSLKILLELYEKNWIDDWYDSARQKEEYRERGKEILKAFHAQIESSPPKTTYLEQGFNLKVKVRGEAGSAHEASDGGDMNTNAQGDRIITIRGVIDRVDAIEGGVEIIDYKTGKVKDLDTADKDQLLIYQIAATEVLGLKPQKLTYYYLEEQKPVSFIGTEEQVAKMKEKIGETVSAIRQSEFKATPSPHVCKFCDYRDICEFRQL